MLREKFANAELNASLTIIEEITPVSDVPVPCQIASLVSVEKITKKMVDGSTVKETLLEHS